jgi:PKD repeat protein/uncharacterized protein YjdB
LLSRAKRKFVKILFRKLSDFPDKYLHKNLIINPHKTFCMTKSTLRSLFVFLLFLSSNVAIAQLTSSFTADDTAGCAPLIVHFTNTSSGATSYSWDLGNGTPPVTSTDASGSYPFAGTYTVTLTAKAGGTSTTYSMIIRAYGPPTVNFSAIPTSVCPGAPITFTNSTVANAWGPVSYTWNFGDGGSSTGTSPIYSYALPGTYNVSLFATNAPGCISSMSKTSYIHIFTPASVGFSTPTTTYCKKPATITFSNSTTGTPTLAYQWEFGDGGTSGATAPTHTYSASGSYNVTLVVTDGNTCKDSLVQPAYINVGSLAAAFTSTSPSCLNIPINFTNTSSGHISSKWSFGDGGTSTNENPVYSYSVAGTYSVKLVVFDGTCYDSIIHVVTILALPVGGFTSIPVEPCPPPVNVTFNATVPGGTTVAWLFGDGTTGTGPSFVKNYPTSVIDFVDMILTNSSGCKDTMQKIDTIYNLFINPSVDFANGCVPLKVNFSMYAYSVVYNTFTSNYDFFTYPYAIASYTWNFGDGSPTSGGPTPMHVYTSTGVFTATVTITTVNGCTGSSTLNVSVGKPPVASIISRPRRVCSDRNTFDSSTSTGFITEYDWSYGDGSPGAHSVATTHAYTAPGIYNVSLMVYDYGCPSVLPGTLTDTVDSPNANINYNFACIPDNEIDFRDYSLGDDSHLWQFGDGTTSTINNPVHDYPSLSAYNVTLTTYNIRSGCRDTTTLYLNLGRPVVDFYATRLQVCRDAMDSVVSLVTGFGLPVGKYRWYDNGVVFDSSHDKLIHTYHTLGLHTITLIVTDVHGCYDTGVHSNYVLVAKPVDTFDFTPTSGCGPLPVTFTDRSTDVAGATIINYAWTFGDGATALLLSPGVAHTYTAAGAYAIREIVTDNIGCKDTLTSHTKLNVYKPTAVFTATSTSVCRDNGVHFNNTSTGIVGSFWVFGDGDTSSATSPVHAYTAAGTYTVKLVVYDSHGCTDTLTRPSYITVNPGPTASFYMSDSFAVCPPLNVHFTNTSSGGSTNFWNFGDSHTLFATSPSEAYLAAGLYTVTLVVTGPTGCTDTATGHVTIFGYAGAFSYAPKSGCSPLYVHFSAVLSTAASIVWDFGDGITSGVTTLDTISHIYASPGAYVPKLILKDTSSGCTSFSIGADTIKVDTLIPGFKISPNPVCVNGSVSFHDSTYSYFSPTKTWLWNFGGGFTSTLSSPTHTFTASGTFPVTLQVTDTNGCTGTITKSVNVNPLPPPITGLFSICKGITSALTDGSPGGTWASSSTSVATVGTSSGIVTGVAQGSATITYTVPLGCIVTTTVTIKPLPSIISGATGICNGLTTTLTDSSAGGVWTSSNTNVATIGSSSGFVTSVALGTTTITYALPAGCATSTVITITNAPLPITGVFTICQGATSPLTDVITGGNWTSGNTSVATIGPSSGFVTGVGLGTSTITYSLGTGCVVNATVVVAPVPGPIKGGSSVCAGLTFSLSDATSGGAWSSSNTFVATVGSGTGLVTGLIGGVDTIVYTLGTGCNAIKSVTVNSSPPITGLTNICLGATTHLTDASPGGTWTSSNTSVATIGSSSGIATGTGAGTTIIKYLLPTGCINTTTLAVIAAPAAITGASAVCVGLNIHLSDATTGGTWTTNNTSVATIGFTSGLLNGLSSGSIIVSYSIGTGCLSISTVNVNPISPITGLKAVCVGQTIRLADTTLGGTWTSSNTAMASVDRWAGIVTGVAAGTATITYALATGCSSIYTVTVNALPSAITGNLQVCAGLLTVLSDATPGGTWTSSNTSVATIPAPGIVSGTTPGTSVIVYFAGGCPATATVTVNPLPANISGSPNLCIGATTTLSDAGGGAWLSSNTAVAIIGSATGFVNGLAAGTSTITYTLSTGCLITTTVIVSPYPLPITGLTQVCDGLTTSLTDGTPGGVWSSVNTSVAIVSSGGVVTGMNAGTTTISYRVGGCPSTIIVTVEPLPNSIAGITSVCVGSVTSLSDAGGGTWTSANTTIATIDVSTGMVSGLVAGTSTVTYTLSTGCIMTTPVTVNPLPAAISGRTILCTTMTTMLSDSDGGGSWSTANTTIATVDPVFGVVSGTVAGSAIITYTLPTGCVAMTTVTVSPFPTTITGNPDVCLFGSSVLSDAIPGGVWTSGNTSVATIGPASGVVTGLTLSTTIITYTIAASCSTFVSVTVMPLPAIFIINGGGTYCSGDTGVHIGLNGSEVGDNYFLYKGGVIATGPLSGTGSPLDFGLQKVAGSYSIKAASASSGCSVAMTGSVTIKVNPTLVPVVNISTGVGDSVCSGTLVKFTGTGIYGGPSPVWKWNVNGTYVSLTNVYSYVPADKDIVTITMTSDTLCASPVTVSKSDTIKVITPQQPVTEIAADPGDTICDGKTVTLTAISSYGGSAPAYAWMKNASLAGSGPVFTYLPDNGDVVYCNMTSSYPCVVAKTVASNSIVITVDSPLIPHIVIVASPGANIGPGWSDTLTAVISNGGLHPSYQWVINGMPVQGATNAIYVSSKFNNGDSVACQVTSSGLCEMTTHNWVYMNVSNVGVQPVGTIGDISVLPNPNKGEFTIKGSLGTNNTEDVSVEITDLLGQVVYRENVTATNGNLNARILLNNNLANSMYILTLRSGVENRVFHIVLER